MKAIAADGVSFAIPIDTAREVVQQLREHGRVLRPYAGIRMLQLTESMLPGLRAQDPAFPSITHGILVSEVHAQSLPRCSLLHHDAQTAGPVPRLPLHHLWHPSLRCALAGCSNAAVHDADSESRSCAGSLGCGR